MLRAETRGYSLFKHLCEIHAIREANDREEQILSVQQIQQSV
jgi:hypothetical protein